MLGEALLGQGKAAEAEPLLVAGAEALVARPEAIPEDARPERLGDAVDRLVRLYEVTDRPEKADEWRARRPPEAGPRPRVVP